MHGSRLKEVNSKTSVTCGINDTVADFFISTIFSVSHENKASLCVQDSCLESLPTVHTRNQSYHNRALSPYYWIQSNGNLV